MSNSDSSKMDVNLNKVICPSCKNRMPAIRIPKDLQQLMWGGWSCPKCDYKMDKHGKEIAE